MYVGQGHCSGVNGDLLNRLGFFFIDTWRSAVHGVRYKNTYFEVQNCFGICL